MIDYILNGLLVTVIGLSMLKTLDPAPARIRMSLSFGAIVLAALPWHWLSNWLPRLWTDASNSYLTPASAVEVVLQPVFDGSLGVREGQDLAFFWLFGLLILVGILSFMRVVQRQHALVKSWRVIAHCNPALSKKVEDIPVWIVPGEKQAVATLFGTREIWIGESLAGHPNIDVALTHELAHHLLRHPVYEWLLTFARCVFWWNPVVWIFVARARKEIEIECDEYCARLMGSLTYQADLARLLSDVEPVPIGSAFGGRGSFNIERLKRLSCDARMNWIRIVAAFFMFVGGGLGFVLVHAETAPSYVKEQKGWSVRFENTTLRKALEQVAEMGGVDIYLDPGIEDNPFTFEAAELKTWKPLLDGVISKISNVHWAERRGVVIVGSNDSINDDSWLSNADVFRGHGVGLFGEQVKRPDEATESLYIDIKFEERIARDDYNTSQMAILISMENPAAIRQGDVHMTFKASSQSNQLSVGFFKVLPDSRLSEVGRASMSLDEEETEHFTWPAVGNIDYKLWLTLKKQQG